MRLRRVFAVLFVALGFLTATLATIGVDARVAAAATELSGVAGALELAPGQLVALEENADPLATAVTPSASGGFPTEGDDYLVLSTGAAMDSVGGNPFDFVSTDLEQAPPGVDGNDLTGMRLSLSPPAAATCLSFEFQFLSEEYPEYVGTEFNDVFTAELNSSDLTKVGDDVVAPRNFAFDSQDNVVSVNALFGFTAMTEDDATTMDGGSPVLVAVTPIERLAGSPIVDLILTIQDIGDPIYDSAVYIDNLQWLFDEGCTAGAFVTPPEFVAPTPVCDSTIEFLADTAKAFTVTAAHDDAELAVTLSATGLPLGATMTPPLPASGNPVSTTLSWTPTSAAAGDHTMTFEATVPNGQPALCTLTLRVPGDEPGQPPTITKVADESPVALGGAVGYAITVANPNPEPVFLDWINDTLPAGFTYSSGSSTGASTADPTQSGQTLTWTGPFTIPAHDALTLHFEGTAASVAGTYLNHASFAIDGVITGTGPTAPVDVEGALTTSKVADRGTVLAGETAGYTITVTNPNPAAQTLTAITDTLPSGFSYVAGSTTGATTADPTVVGTELQWPGLFSVPGDGSVSLHFLATAASTPGEYFNRAAATSATATVEPTGPTAPVLVVLPLTLTASADKSPVRINASAPHTITVVNPNPTPAPIMLSALVPAGFTYVAGSTTGLTTANPVLLGGALVWGRGAPGGPSVAPLEVAPFSTATLRYAVKAPASPGPFATNVTLTPMTGGDVEPTTTDTSGILTAVAPIVINAATTLTASPAIAQVKAGSPTVYVTLGATLRIANTARGVAGKRIDFKSFGLDVCSAVTNAQGVATCGGVIGAAQAVLGLGYRGTFAGSTYHLASTGLGDLVVVGSTKI